MYGRRRTIAPPHWIIARYGGVCTHCKLGIKKGENALYFPASRTMLCSGQECGKQYERDAAANAFDEAMYNGGRL